MAMQNDEEDAGGLFMVAVEEVGMPGLWTYVKDVSAWLGGVAEPGYGYQCAV
jgi:hypothetical protein